LGFRVWGLGLRVSGLGLRGLGFEGRPVFDVCDPGLEGMCVPGFGFRV
jgi:hypothetical protein